MYIALYQLLLTALPAGAVLTLPADPALTVAITGLCFALSPVLAKCDKRTQAALSALLASSLIIQQFIQTDITAIILLLDLGLVTVSWQRVPDHKGFFALYTATLAAGYLIFSLLPEASPFARSLQWGMVATVLIVATLIGLFTESTERGTPDIPLIVALAILLPLQSEMAVILFLISYLISKKTRLTLVSIIPALIIPSPLLAGFAAGSLKTTSFILQLLCLLAGLLPFPAARMVAALPSLLVLKRKKTGEGTPSPADGETEKL